MWLARRAAVRKSQVWIPPGTPPLVQPRKIQEQKSIGTDFPSAAAGDTSAAAGVSARHQGWILYQYCRQKITKINKKSAGKGTKNFKKFIAGVNDTAEKLLTGVNNTAIKFFGSVNDTGN